MKRTTFVIVTMLVVFVAVLSVLVLRPVTGVKASTGCSNATLIGNYGLVAQGFYNVPDPGFVPADFSMLATFNGKGAFTASNLNIVVNGGLEPGSPFTVTGTYTCLPSCACTWTIPNSPTVNPWDAVITVYGIAVDTGGDEIAGNLLSANPNITGTFDAKRVATGKWNFFE